MARILVNDKWYEEVSPTAFYESDYERLIIQHSGIIYPDYYIVPFNELVYSDERAAKADFALIDKRYRNWWVGEIETASHLLEGHVLPQVRVLSDADYSRVDASCFIKHEPALSHEGICNMLKGKQPRVIVIVNAPKADWVVSLNRYDAILAIIEVFRSFDNKYILRINGQQLPSIVESISECRVDKTIPRLLKIMSPAILPIRTNEKIIIKFKDGYCEWQRIDSRDTVWLMSVGHNPLSTKMIYELRLQENGKIELIESPARR